MNNFERKLCQQPFRTPPPDLRVAIFGAPTNVVEPARWTWRDWFWPSPQAWAALAAVWVVFAALNFSGHESAAPEQPLAQQPPSDLNLLTLHRARDLNHVLELAN